MCFSNTLLWTLSSDIGQELSGEQDLPDLGLGTIVNNFHPLGTLPLLIDKLNSCISLNSY